MRRCIAISATVMFLAQVSYARLSGQQSSGQELLQQVKQALRAPGKAWGATMVSGKAVRGGVEHAYSFAYLPDGRFVQSFQGSDSKTLGNDGRQYWQEDYSHFVQELDFGDRDRQMAINLLLSDNWLLAPAPIQLTASEGGSPPCLQGNGRRHRYSRRCQHLSSNGRLFSDPRWDGA